MTARKSDHRARGARKRIGARTFARDLASSLRRLRDRGMVFPAIAWRERPVDFVQQVLGVRLWHKQREVVAAMVGSRRVAVRSGHKIGKSRLAVCVALWFYLTHPGARVLFTSSTAAQVDRILWRELRIVLGQSLITLDEQPGELARTGLRASDYREIFGFSSKEAEAVAGISGVNLLYIADEASGISSAIFEAMQGNMMAGARCLLLGNPTRNEGEFFDAFHSKSEYYATFTISSEDTPNCTGEEERIPGLAELSEIKLYEREHGRESAWFKIRVLGLHALQDDGRIFSIATLADAEAAWDVTDPTGRLSIGVDPSGPSGAGDDAVFVARRGNKVLEVIERKGLDAQGHLSVIVMLARKHQPKPRDGVIPRPPSVVLDGGGEWGVKVARALREYLERNPSDFELTTILASDAACREVRIYDRMRDLLAGNLEAWFRNGGAVPVNAKLSAELHVFRWEIGLNGKQKLRPEKDGASGVRRLLGRSPDRYDALALACWEPGDFDGAPAVSPPLQRPDPYDQREAPPAERPAAGGAEFRGNSAASWGHGDLFE